MSDQVSAHGTDLKPIFIEQLEHIQGVFAALAAQDVKPLAESMTPEAMLILGRDLYEKHVRMIAMCKESNSMLAHSLNVLRDLQIAKAPDTELIAREIWTIAAAHRCKTSSEAFSAAEEFVKLKNTRRISGK